MRELNHLKDNIVVFTAVEEAMDSTPSSSGATRTPLQPTNTQLFATPNVSIPEKDSVPVKVEISYASPYSVSPSVQVKDENGDVLPRSQTPVLTSKCRQYMPPQPWSLSLSISHELTRKQEVLHMPLPVPLPRASCCPTLSLRAR